MIFDDVEAKNAMLASIIDSSEDAIISKTLNGIITTWNKSAERIFGFTEQEAIGKHVFLIIPEYLHKEEDMIISSLRAGRRIEHYQTIRLTKEGKRINISLTISPIKNSHGEVIGASKIARDITKQKQNEELIRQYARRLEIINSVGKTFTSQLEIPAILQTVTEATTQLAGATMGAFVYSRIDLKGNPVLLYSFYGESQEGFRQLDIPKTAAQLEGLFNNVKTFRSGNINIDPKYKSICDDGGEGLLRLPSFLAIPVISQNSKVIGGLFFGHSTEGRFAEEHEGLVEAIASQAAIALDNAKLYEEIHTLNNKKDDFISFASHELKTPLTTIKGYLQLAEASPNGSEEFLPKINKQVLRLQRLITDLLDISKIHAEKMDMHFSLTSLNGLINESIEAVIHDKHTVEFDSMAEDILVNIDKPKMIQVLTNVISNAVKYSPENSKVFISAIRFGDRIKITILDTGFGIAPQHLDKIFTQYYRISKSSNKVEGMGLGLFISKEIIEQHEGKIWAESEEGKGTAFHVVFPIENISF